LPDTIPINPLNAELNPICRLLALLGGATIVVVSRLRVKNGLKQDASLLVLYNFAVEYAITMFQVRQDGYKLNSTHQLLVYAGDVSILG
jgi:hypothetical protein